ncbi:MAG: HAMP domain-containing histidine kinase [Acidobacteriota bacterium]|nr:HAMP domain-containing histidine kinase [Acidobacteriota bacterium]
MRADVQFTLCGILLPKVRALDTPLVRDRYVSWRRLLAGGITLALLAGLIGAVLEWRRFGRDASEAVARVDQDVRRDFDEKTALLGRLASTIAADPGTTAALKAARSLQGSADPDATRRLFEILDARTGEVRDRPDIAFTIYDYPSDVARAWAGRPSDLPGEQIRSTRSWFVTPSAQGLRLVHVVPIKANDDAPIGVVVAEHALSGAPVPGALAQDVATIPTAVGPASVVFQYEGAGEQKRTDVFLLRAPTGDVLLEASLPSEQIARARVQLRRSVVAVVLALLAVTLILLTGPLLDRRAGGQHGSTPAYGRSTIGAALLVLAGAALAWAAIEVAAEGPPGYSVLLLLAGSAAAGVIALLAAPMSRWRARRRLTRRDPAEATSRFVGHQVLAGTAVAGVVSIFAVALRHVLAGAPVDLQHFSLHPWSSGRLTLLAGILTSNLAALWAATTIFAVALTGWRFPRRDFRTLAFAWTLWTLPSFVVAAAATYRGWSMPALGLVLSAVVCAAAALAARDAARWFRHTTVAARILALFLAFLLPSLLLYPSVNFYTSRAVRSVIATQFAVQAQRHPEMLQTRLDEVRGQIDAISSLPNLVSGTETDPGAEGCPIDAAFFVWRQTTLARARLTSAVELYDADGAIVSCFALNFPEYTNTPRPPLSSVSCEWKVFGEAAPFGANERRMLHAEKGICEGQRVLGSIVLHVGLDYRTLPFITSQSPYFEVFRTEGGAPAEGTTGSDVELVIYGWGLTPLYASGAVAWPITPDLFARIYGSREPFWTEIERGDIRWNVFFSNDRNGIYGLGYPALTLFDRLVHLAELTTLAGAVFVLVLIGTAFFTRVARERPRVGRALLREIRASFYRKLFLAFVLASIIPVLTLALVIRAYFAGLLRADVEAEAARSASVARRVIEETQALPLRGGEPLPPASDDVLIWISQVIDQDVNIFRGPGLLATSERDLFASGLLPTRTPAAVYRAIALQRLPSFVVEDRIATLPYMIAATPVSAGGREAILTVPLANQQREIEREVDEIDRGIHLAALFFILVGAAMGLSMAERIADPVRRLTRATRRIASGDFDARIAVRSADELRRLVDAFNSMAGELKAQRTQLERTHRLEAWADMARQVAHEIKNPLTPIQLSAEHLRRVHADRGEPMGAVLESCVTSILGQVRLLRQISSEFSNFASSPVAHPAAVDLPELVAEVVDPYRTGLGDRIVIDNRVAPPLPAVLIDRILIGRALVNIIENALHAMPSTGSITLTAAPTGDAVVLRACDTGVGMDEEALARVFEPYFSTKATGTGLGLPIARRNVELSGGRIDVESAKGQGTTVILTLPLHG